jgi:di/tricarboxylate transporter
MLEQLFVAGVFIGLLYCLVFTHLSPARVFAAATALVWFAGLVETGELLDKATNTGLVTLLLLLLVSIGLEKLSWLSRLSGGVVVPGYRRTLLRLSVVTGFFSAFVNNTAVVATLANALRENGVHLPSRLLLPLSYAAVLGGTTTLIGTSTNLIVSSFLEDATGSGLAFFDFLPIGAAALAVGIVVIVLSARLLPSNERREVAVAEYVVEAEVTEGSSLVGRSIADNGLRELEALFLVEVVRGEHLISPVSPQEYIEVGDKLIFSGMSRACPYWSSLTACGPSPRKRDCCATTWCRWWSCPGPRSRAGRSRIRVSLPLRRRRRRPAPRRSATVGKLGSITLQAGDSLMLAIGGDFYERRNVDKNFLVVGSRQVTPAVDALRGNLVGLAMLLAVTFAATGVVPLIKGLAGVLVLMLALGVVRPGELRRRFPFDLALIIAAALVLSQALLNSGLVAALAAALHTVVDAGGPYLALLGVYLGTLLLTETMTNNAAAALVFPVAYGLAEAYGLNVTTFAMAVAYGASASFLTPYSYNTNLMVQNLGDYRFTDYTRFGLPLSIAYSAVVLALLPRVFPLYG